MSLAVLFAGSANTVSKPVDEFFVSVRVLDQSEVEERRVVDGEVLSKDRQWSSFSGGELTGSEDASSLEFGFRINGQIANSEGEPQSVVLRIKMSHLYDCGKNSIPVVRGEMFAHRADLKLGEAIRIPCGGNLSCVLRLDRQEK